MESKQRQMLGPNIFEKLLARSWLHVFPSQCLRLRHKKSTCQLCLDNCPTAAIIFGESLEIDYSRCQGCGICVNMCPTGVFELKELSYPTLLSTVGERSVIEFACSLSPQGEGNVIVPCLGYLNEAVLIGAAVYGAQAMRFNITYCKNCKLTSGLRVAMRSLRRANKILALFEIPKKVLVTTNGSGGDYSLRNNRCYSRREFFSGLRKGTWDIVTRTIDSTLVDGEGLARTRVTLEPRLPKKRTLLLEHLKLLGQPATEQAKADNLPFAQVEIGDGCDGCGMCAKFCPTGALRLHDDGKRKVMDFNSGRCLGCNLCSDICPRNIITYSAVINPYDIVADSRRILREYRKSACSQCGQTHIAATGSSLCLNCSKKKELNEWLTRV